jgi:hypothetical protein
LLVEWILEIFPDAWILHIIRDPRDAVASIVRSGQSWGESWAPKSPIPAARMWRHHVLRARKAAELTDKYLEIRYEDLRAHPHENLKAILDWMGLTHHAGFVRSAVEACDLSKLRENLGEGRPMPAERPPSGFFGKGAVGGWPETLGRRGAIAVEKICFSEMVELGYTPVIAKNGKNTFRISLYNGIRRMRESIDWQIARLMNRI